MNITKHTASELFDPTGILLGKRYEFLIYIDFDEEDELHEEGAGGIRTLYIVDGENDKITSSYFFKKGNEQALEFELEDEEQEEILAFCRENVVKVEESSKKK